MAKIIQWLKSFWAWLGDLVSRRGRRNQSGSGVTPFDPNSIAGLVSWYRADTKVLNGSNVSTWTDKSGNGNDLVQGTAGAQPAWNASTASFGNKPTVGFTNGKFLATSGNTTYGPFTWFIVFSATVDGYVGMRGPSGALFAERFCTSDVSYDGLGTIVTRRLATVTASTKNLSASWGSDGVVRTATWRFDGTHAGHIIRLNGTQQTTTDGSRTADPTVALQAQKIAVPDNDSADTLVGTIAEEIIYNSALSNGDCATVEAYLKSRYGHY